MSFKHIIETTYGSGTHHKTSLYMKKLTKMTRAKNQLVFLNRCIHHQLIPRFLRVHCPITSVRGTNITEQYHRDLLIPTRNDTRSRFFRSHRDKNVMLMEIQMIISEEHYNLLRRITEATREKVFNSTKNKLKQKFELLFQEKYRRPFSTNQPNSSHVKNCVLNLHTNEIPENHKELLNLGPKFAVNPRSIPYMDIITTTEVEALKLENQEEPAKAALLRREVQTILKKAKPPPSNLTEAQRQAIKEIKDDEDCVIYPFDKGNGFVRMSQTTADTKMIEGIGRTTILQKDPTKTHMTKIQKTLCSMRKQIEIPKRLYHRIYPSDAIPPRAYGQCKAHKPTKQYPFRILVSTIGTAPYGLSEYLVNIIQPTLSKSEYFVKNSRTFVEEAKSWSINPNEVQVSFDVVALYPSVPVKKAIANLMDILKADEQAFLTRTVFRLDHIKDLLEVCLWKSYFLWDGRIHCLEDSGPIGLSLMVVLAESFLQTLEKNALTIATSLPTPCAPITHRRYVDDTHDRFLDRTESEAFLVVLNQQERRIQYTAEYENDDKELSYLDITSKNSDNGAYEFKVFRKDAITNVQIKENSCHDQSTRDGVFKGFLSRAKAICSPQHLQSEIEFLINVFISNGYKRVHLEKLIAESNRPRRVRSTNHAPPQYTSMPYVPGLDGPLKKAFRKAGCKLAFKAPRNLSSILTSRNKPKLPPKSNQGVYFIPTGCNKGYTGETGKQIDTRTTEHAKAIFNGDVAHDAIAAHKAVCDCTDRLEETKILAVEPLWYRRKVREALEIQRLKTGPNDTHGINKDNGDYVTTTSWNPLFDQINADNRANVETFESMTL